MKQLATTQYIFPSANHSRLEHSFGVYFLANKYLKYLQQTQPELEINDNIIRSISLAGLCYNIGNSPFSIPFKDFCKEKLNMDWVQSEYASKVLDNVIETEGIDPIKEDFDYNLVQNIITKSYTNTISGLSHWTEQIVNNTKNGIDVNIFDSLLRDNYKFGFPNQSYDYQILMNNSRVINNEICFRANDAFSIDELFSSQYCIAKKFYTHRVTKAIELMIKDLFIESSSYYDYLTILQNIDQYIDLTDNILSEIMYSKSSKLTKAKDIINRINKRDFYIFAGEYDSSNSLESFQSFNENTLLNYTSESEINITKEDIRILKLNLNLGIGKKDPMKNVNFYNSHHDVFHIKREDISNLLSNRFEEMIIRIYVTSKDEKKISAAQQALINFCKAKGSEASLYKSAKKQIPIRSEPYSFDSCTTKELFKEEK